MNKIIIFSAYKESGNDFTSFLKGKGVKYDYFFFFNKPGYSFVGKAYRIKMEIMAFIKLLFTFSKLSNKTIYCTGCQMYDQTRNRGP